MYRSAGVLVLVLLAVSLPSAIRGSADEGGAHSIARGTRKVVSNKPADILLYHESVKSDGTLFPFPMVTSHDLCYPPKRSHQAKFTITAFNIADAGKGGLAHMKKDGGGVGKHKVCFQLKSSRGKGYHFNVDVWGYYN